MLELRNKRYFWPTSIFCFLTLDEGAAEMISIVSELNVEQPLEKICHSDMVFPLYNRIYRLFYRLLREK